MNRSRIFDSGESVGFAELQTSQEEWSGWGWWGGGTERPKKNRRVQIGVRGQLYAGVLL